MRGRPTIRPIKNVPHPCSLSPCFPASLLRDGEINCQLLPTPRLRFSIFTFPISISNRNTVANRKRRNSMKAKEKTFSNRNKNRYVAARKFHNHSPALLALTEEGPALTQQGRGGEGPLTISHSPLPVPLGTQSFQSWVCFSREKRAERNSFRDSIEVKTWSEQPSIQPLTFSTGSVVTR